MRSVVLIGSFFIVPLIGGISAVAQSSPESNAIDASALTIDRIFASDEFQEERFETPVWSRNKSAWFALERANDGENGKSLVRVDAATGEREILVPATAFTPAGGTEPLGIDSFELSPDESKMLIFTNSQRVWRRNTRGDYWMLDLGTRELKQLGGDAEPRRMMFAKFSPDGTRIAWVRRNNIYVQNLHDLNITAVTADRSPTLINGTSDWVNEEELDLRDCFRWSPDSQSIAFWQFDTSGVREFHLVNNTDDTYPRITSFAYPKTGEQNSATRLGVVSVGGGIVTWLNIPGDPREHYLPKMEWSPDGSQLMVQQLNRIQNTNRVMLADPATGATQTVLTETDECWLENENPVRWIDGDRQFLWVSERDGWRHVYLASVDGSPMKLITRGEFDVIAVEGLDEDNGWLYYSASPDNPTQRYLYRCRLDGSGTEPLVDSVQPGWNTCSLSPNAEWAILTWSNFSTPPVHDLVRLSDRTLVRRLLDNDRLRQRLSTLNLPTSELFRIDIGENTPLDCWCLMPPQLDKTRKYPLLIHVYGEPHGQTVRDAWFGPRGLWHWMLAQQGTIVASIENRGTIVPRGRAWRKVVHRKIGQLASQDQAAATRALLKRWPIADERRIGIWGWSGGGSMSLNAIFRYPELYQTAMAVAPVPDQRLYDTIYQERYMGLPSDNADGYRDGSPLTFAHQLRGNLLIVHGTGDDNCHYQGVEMLINELIARDKQFTVMPYPNRTHSVSEGVNTTKHLYSLLTKYLQEHMQN